MKKRRYGKYISVYKNGRYVRVNSPKRGTAWKRLREYINSMEVGEVFTRQQMLEKLVHPDMRKGYQLSVDLYRRTITIVGFLEIVARGQYKILQHIPDISISRLTKMAYNDSWKIWFLKPEDW